MGLLAGACEDVRCRYAGLDKFDLMLRDGADNPDGITLVRALRRRTFYGNSVQMAT